MAERRITFEAELLGESVPRCGRHKKEILATETLNIKEVNMPCGGKKTGGKRPPKK